MLSVGITESTKNAPTSVPTLTHDKEKRLRFSVLEICEIVVEVIRDGSKILACAEFPTIQESSTSYITWRLALSVVFFRS
jgi:hypothetical protein